MRLTWTSGGYIVPGVNWLRMVYEIIFFSFFSIIFGICDFDHVTTPKTTTQLEIRNPRTENRKPWNEMLSFHISYKCLFNLDGSWTNPSKASVGWMGLGMCACVSTVYVCKNNKVLIIGNNKFAICFNWANERPKINEEKNVLIFSPLRCSMFVTFFAFFGNRWKRL